MSKQSNGQEPKQPWTVRLSVTDQERLEKAAERVRKSTGRKESAHSLAQKMIYLGLAQIENTGDLIISV